MAETQQKRGDVLPLDSVVLGRCIASPHKVPHRLVTLIRNPDRGQLTSPQQLHEIDGVAPIGLDPITRLGRDQRRRHHHAVMAKVLDQSVETVSCRASLVAERQSSVFTREFCHELACRGFSIVELAEIANLTISTCISNRHCIAQFRRVQRHERFAMMLHTFALLVRGSTRPVRATLVVTSRASRLHTERDIRSKSLRDNPLRGGPAAGAVTN